MPNDRFHLITCEHAGNRIPSRYAAFFDKGGTVLRSHVGYDIGALGIARDLADALRAPLVVSAISRLLIDLNRSPDSPALYSAFTLNLDEDLRKEIFNRYYLPYRTKVQDRIAFAINAGTSVFHLSVHSFAPEMHGELRSADFGLLYDPARSAEHAACERWHAALKHHAPALTTRMNYPYLGTDDGLVTTLRTHFPERYVGIELEVNQKHLLESGPSAAAFRRSLADALRDALS